MKEKYEPIQIPECLCGKRPKILNRISCHQSAFIVVRWHERMNEQGLPEGFHAKLKKLPLWICSCKYCRAGGIGATKRQAVEEFRKHVENSRKDFENRIQVMT